MYTVLSGMSLSCSIDSSRTRRCAAQPRAAPIIPRVSSSRYHGGEDGVRSDEAARHTASGLTRHISRENDPDVIPHIPVLVERRCALTGVERLGHRAVGIHIDAHLRDMLLSKPTCEQSNHRGGNSSPPIAWRDKEILQLALAVVPMCPVSGNVAVDRSASPRHVPDAREQRLLRMVLALEVGGHARIRHTGRWISQSASRHCRDVRARRFSELNTVDHGHACACVRILRCSICYDFWCGLDGADPREPESTSRASLQSLEKAAHGILTTTPA